MYRMNKSEIPPLFYVGETDTIIERPSIIEERLIWEKISEDGVWRIGLIGGIPSEFIPEKKRTMWVYSFKYLGWFYAIGK